MSGAPVIAPSPRRGRRRCSRRRRRSRFAARKGPYAAFAEEFTDQQPAGAEDRAVGLANKRSPPHAPAMFVVTEAEADAIRAVYQQRGEFAAAVELRRLFPGVTDNAQARACARSIAGWKPLPLRPVKRMPKVPRVRPVR